MLLYSGFWDGFPFIQRILLKISLGVMSFFLYEILKMMKKLWIVPHGKFCFSQTTAVFPTFPAFSWRIHHSFCLAQFGWWEPHVLSPYLFCKDASHTFGLPCGKLINTEHDQQWSFSVTMLRSIISYLPIYSIYTNIKDQKRHQWTTCLNSSNEARSF